MVGVQRVVILELLTLELNAMENIQMRIELGRS